MKSSWPALRLQVEKWREEATEAVRKEVTAFRKAWVADMNRERQAFLDGTQAAYGGAGDAYGGEGVSGSGGSAVEPAGVAGVSGEGGRKKGYAEHACSERRGSGAIGNPL